MIHKLPLETEVRYIRYKLAVGRISIFKFDVSKNIKFLLAAVMIITISVAIISYGVVYSECYTEDARITNDKFIQQDSDFQFKTNMQSLPMFEGEIVFSTDVYEKSGATDDFIDMLNNIKGVNRVVAYKENRKMCILFKEDNIDDYTEGAIDWSIDGRINKGVINLPGLRYKSNNPDLFNKTFGYSDDDYLVGCDVIGFSDEELLALEEYVVEGKINLEKIHSGDEIILRVPSYILKETDELGFPTIHMEEVDYRDNNAINFTSYKVGDEITLTGLYTSA